MKILKYIGIIIVIAVAGFLSLGLFVVSFDYTASVTVNDSPENCWAVLHDSSRMKKVIPGFVSLTLKNGEHLKAGAEYEITIIQDKTYIMRETIKEINAPQWVSFELVNDVMNSYYDYSLTSKSSHTEISNHYHIVGNNVVWKSILFLSKSHLQKECQAQLEMLKKEIESGNASGN